MTKTDRRAVHKVDSQIALAEPRTLDEVKGLMLADDRFTMSLYVAFGIVALILAGVGIYGVMGFTVAQREHELGLRMALGASRGNVVKLVLKEALVLAVPRTGAWAGGLVFCGPRHEEHVVWSGFAGLHGHCSCRAGPAGRVAAGQLAARAKGRGG